MRPKAHRHPPPGPRRRTGPCTRRPAPPHLAPRAQTLNSPCTAQQARPQPGQTAGGATDERAAGKNQPDKPPSTGAGRHRHHPPQPAGAAPHCLPCPPQGLKASLASRPGPMHKNCRLRTSRLKVRSFFDSCRRQPGYCFCRTGRPPPQGGAPGPSRAPGGLPWPPCLRFCALPCLAQLLKKEQTLNRDVRRRQFSRPIFYPPH